jgi:hypothetical protein
MPPRPKATVNLYWIPLGARGHSNSLTSWLIAAPLRTRQREHFRALGDIRPSAHRPACALTIAAPGPADRFRVDAALRP